MNDISSVLRSAVILRAGNRCEYCKLSQEGQEAAFHIDHVQPRAADGPTHKDNFALACVSCSLHKAARQIAIDSVTGQDVSLFNPRQQIWPEHFRWDGFTAVGITPIGRATITALKMNRLLILAIREEESHRGRHPH